MPPLKVTEAGGRVRLELGGFAQGEGSSLQEAADDLISRILDLALALRSRGCTASTELTTNLDAMNLLHELGKIAAGGGDIRPHVFP